MFAPNLRKNLKLDHLKVQLQFKIVQKLRLEIKTMDSEEDTTKKDIRHITAGKFAFKNFLKRKTKNAECFRKKSIRHSQFKKEMN